jgi:hypothetical protein
MPVLDYLNIYRVAAGRCPGMSFVEFVARNPDVDTGTVPETVGPTGGVLTFRAAAAVVEVVSSSADDDGSPAGTGAWTIRIDGLDANWDMISETVTLNGTTAVATVQEFLRINMVEVTTAGTGGVNAGNITLRDAGAGATRSYIVAARGRSEVGMVSVPRDHMLLGDGWYATANSGVGGKASALIDVMEIHSPENVSHVAWTVGVEGSFMGGFDVPHAFREMTDIHIIVRSVGANDTVVAFHGHGIMVGPNADL